MAPVGPTTQVPTESLQAEATTNLVAAARVSGRIVSVDLSQFIGHASGPQCMQRLVERLQVICGYDDRGDAPVTGDLDDFVSSVGLPNQRRQLVLGL